MRNSYCTKTSLIVLFHKLKYSIRGFNIIFYVWHHFYNNFLMIFTPWFWYFLLGKKESFDTTCWENCNTQTNKKIKWNKEDKIFTWFNIITYIHDTKRSNLFINLTIIHFKLSQPFFIKNPIYPLSISLGSLLTFSLSQNLI